MRYPTIFCSVFALFISLYLSGCATYSELPAGTRLSLGEPSEGVVNREIVGVPASEASPYHPADYVIGPNDVLSITINGLIDYSSGNAIVQSNSKVSGYRVDGLGCIYIPLAGEVHVGGRTMSATRNLINSTMLKYFNNPHVVIEIAEYRNRLVFVFGAVKIQGPLPITPGGMNLAQAIAGAQLKDTGYNLEKVRIIRSFSPTQGELLVVDFNRVMQGKALPMALHEGDIIYIPKSAMGSWNDAISDILPSLQAVSTSLQPFVNIKYLKN